MELSDELRSWDGLCRFWDGDLCREDFETDVPVSGNILREETWGDIKTLYGEVLTDGVRDGVYASVLCPRIPDRAMHDDLTSAVCSALLDITGEKDGRKYERVLICGLGNSAVLVDSIGTSVVDMIVTGDVKRKVYAVKTGTEGATGIASSDMVKLFVSHVKPELVICVDSLAARSSERLGTVVQITNSGISPGAGVAFGSRPIREESVGVPVISVGIPTVIRGTCGGIYTCAVADRLVKYGAAVIAGGINAFLYG